MTDFILLRRYHSLTSLKNSQELKENTKNVILDYLALGLDPNISTLFIQSNVPEHIENLLGFTQM